MLSLALLSLSFLASSVLAAPLTSEDVSLLRRAGNVYLHCAKPKTAAITFDDGPYIYLKDIVNTLDKANAKGTFFFNGNNWDCIYSEGGMDRVKYAYSHGHQIASHTWSHKHLNSLSRNEIDDEMFRVEQAFERIVGVTPALMRPPYGEYNQLVQDVSRERGQDIAIWDLDSGDTTGAPIEESKRRYDEAIGRPNILTLNHETKEPTAHDLLPYAIEKLQGAGYQLVTVAECLGLPAYQKVGPPQVPDPTWMCTGPPVRLLC